MDPLEEAARRVARGDPSAFRELVEATSYPLVRLAARILGSMSEAEDAVQEAYIKAYAALGRGEFDGRSSVKTWLYRIVTHTAIDALRGRARRERSSDDATGAAWDGAAAADAHLALGELSDWLDELPADQRAALVLKGVEGLSTSEIAKIIGL